MPEIRHHETLGDDMITSDSILTSEAQSFIDTWLNDNGYIIAHTSGSTGKPKEIRLSKTDMLMSAKSTNRFFGIGKESTLLLPLSLDYIAGKMQIVRAIAAGCRIIVEKPTSLPFTWYRGECTMLPIVPSQLDGLMGSYIARAAEHILIGGAPLSPTQEHTVLKKRMNVYISYGMTETCSHVALRKAGERKYHGLAGFTFDTDNRGCLIIKSSTMSFGKLATNDVVKPHDAQSFEWLGRYDNVINSGGIKIHPEEIERVMQPLLPQGTTAYVTSRVDKWLGEEVVIVTDNPNLNNGLLDQLKEQLPRYQAPRAIIFQLIQRTPTGKIIRVKNPELPIL